MASNQLDKTPVEYSLSIEYDTESDKYWMRGRLAEIDREIAQRVAADLERQENFDRWKVSVATKRNDMFESLF